MRRWLGLAAILLAACAGPPEGEPSPAAVGVDDTQAPASWSGDTRRVPGDYPTIQAAVDAAAAGDLILVGEGVYPEEVQISTPGLTLRGADREEVVIDGESVRPNGVIVFADGVAIENLTVRNATENGLLWTGVRGYRASYVTALDNEVYGIYAFDSGDGLFEHSYAAGSYDAGFYIGQCDPCQAVIRDVVAEWNGLGYSGTNASGDLYIVDSVWRHNVAGIVPNTLDTELLPPFHGVTIAGNLIHDNGNREAPSFTTEWSGYGNGVILAGGNDSVVTRNRIVNHPTNGVAVTPNLSRNLWMSGGNRVTGNVIEGSGRADIALAGPASTGNCFEDNGDPATFPVGLELLQPCEGVRLPVLFELAGSTEQLGRIAESELGLKPPGAESAPRPDAQPQLPQGAEAPVRPATNVFTQAVPDLARIEVPATEIPVHQQRGVTLFGILFSSAPGVFFGLYAYLLPFVLYAAWVGIALWDLVRRDEVGRGGVIAWTAAILLVPFLGVVAYHLFSRSPIPLWHRLTYVVGGILAYVVILGLGALAGGIV